MEGTPLLDLTTIQEDTSKLTWKKKLLYLVLLIIGVFVLFIGIGALVLQYSYLPDRVQSSIDDSTVTVKSSLLTQPGISSFHLISEAQTNANTPYPATISGATYTFKFCAPNTTYSFLPYDPNCTYDSDASIIGYCAGPKFDISTSGLSSIPFNSNFTITNLSNFQLFSSYLFVLQSVDWRIEAKVDVTVTVIGVPFKVSNVKLNKMSPCSGLNSLPGVKTEYLDFFYNSSMSELMPILNTTVLLFNPGTTSFVPLGDLRYEYLINFNFTHDVPPNLQNLSNYEHFATVISPNVSVFSGFTSVYSQGPVTSRVLKTGGWDLLLENYFKGIPSPIVGWNTHNWDPCCNWSVSTPSFIEADIATPNGTIPNSTCECIPASSIPLYDAFLQGLILYIEITPAPSSTVLFLQILIDVNRLRVGGTQQLTLQLTNPFAAPLSFDHINLTIYYNSVVMATYDATGTPIVQLNGYETQTVKPLGLAHFASYANNTKEESTLEEFIRILKSGNNATGSLSGGLDFRIVQARAGIEYWQKTVNIVPIESLEDVYASNF